jgi:hypothetical protein
LWTRTSSPPTVTVPSHAAFRFSVAIVISRLRVSFAPHVHTLIVRGIP